MAKPNKAKPTVKRPRSKKQAEHARSTFLDALDNPGVARNFSAAQIRLLKSKIAIMDDSRLIRHMNMFNMLMGKAA